MRSLLFAGAGRPDLIQKLPRSAPDAAVVDLEDAVPDSHKSQARAAATGMVERVVAAHPELPVFVRVNGVRTQWFADDIATGVSRSAAGVVVPKVEEPAQLDHVRQALADVGLDQLRIIVGIESARGVAHVEQLLSPLVHAAYFGAEDYIADLGGTRTPDGDEALYARSRFVLAARLAGVLPIDQAVLDVRADESFRRDALRGRALGYCGKICVHPRQTELANEIFGASQQDRDRAERLLRAWRDGSRDGSGAIEFEGAMIDEPALRMARQTLQRASARA